MLLLISCAVVFLAGLVQRLTGLGFALFSTPLLVLLFGPDEGVRLVIVLGLIVCGIMGATMLRGVDWARTWGLIWPALVTAPIAAWVAHVSPEPVLLIIVGCAAVLGLLSAKLRRLSRFLVGRPGTMVAGGFAGFLNVTSGLSGPPLVAYAESIRWNPARFVASLQVLFVVYNIVTLAWRGPPAIEGSSMLLLALAAVVGLLAGVALTRVVPARWARVGMFGIAWAGSAAVLFRGAAGLFGIG